MEIVTLASGQDSDRYLMGLRGRQDKNNIGRRLFQCFQKSVECSCLEHMHLIDDVNLIFALCWTLGYFLADLTDVVLSLIHI